jgi:mono/diheme cytochrome c family protein
MRRTLALCFCCILALVVLSYWRIPADAFETYTASPDAFDTNCAQCHGDFRASPYTSLSDGV